MKHIILFLALIALAREALPQSGELLYDVVLLRGRVVDGSGNPWYEADVGVREGRIVAIGRLDAARAHRVLDAEGLIVAPGFIDVHTHAEEGILAVPTADNFVFDGVTSIITGNCGGSRTDLQSFFDELRRTGISLNVGSLIGHNSVRRAVMGTAQRDPTADELRRMEELVDQAMRAGAVGFSTGLIYIPGTYAKTPEVVALARVAAKHNGIYASHIRNEGNDEQGGIFTAIEEALNIGREARIPVQISHFKVSSKLLWGQSTKTIAMIERARKEGLDVTVDQYPYAASSTNLGILLPSWAHADGDSAMKARLHNPTTRKRIAAEMRNTVINRNGRDRLDYAIVARCRWDSTLDGKSITEVNLSWKRNGTLDDEIETVMDMLERGGAQMVYHSMSEVDVERIMRYPYAMIASDAGVISFGVGMPHPRGYGTNARVLGQYVREKNVLRLEEAIRKMTSLPAQRFRLTDRGLLRVGMRADIVVFDERFVTDHASFEMPHRYASGFAAVLVNGEVVVEYGRHTGARPGEILLGPAASAGRTP